MLWQLLLLVRLWTATATKRPNFVVILTDDLDWTLGGTNASTLYRTRKLIGDKGKTFSNWFVHTPVCCSSRAELMTGKFFHNLRLPNQSAQGCMHVDVTDDPLHPFYARDYFAHYFDQLNYSVGIFGKHLNNCNPSSFVPRGVDEMMINNGGLYLDPEFTVGTRGNQPKEIQFDNCTESTGMPCYSTAVIGNASLAWMARHVQANPNQPFFNFISVKAPHIQDGPGYPVSIPAPWYTNTVIPEQLAPRTPNYNFSATDHHWVVRTQTPLTKLEAEKVDALYVSRLKTLLSVDDLVEELFHKLEELQVLDNTYVFFTSDNGYRLGQFQIPQLKLHPYENDIRVPMMIRGPGIQPGSVSSLLSTHVDFMPTLLGLATHPWERQEEEIITIPPSTMDGINLAAHILDQPVKNNESRTGLPLSILIEYYSFGPIVRYNHLVDTYNHTFRALRIVDPFRNYKYIEFRDSRYDWNCTRPPLEQEFFDLDRDPFEMHNLMDWVSDSLLEALKSKMERLFHCKGSSCRKEQLEPLSGRATDWFKTQTIQSLN